MKRRNGFPVHIGRVALRLGMTPGGLIAVCVLTAAVIAGFALLENVNTQQDEIIRSNRLLVLRVDVLAQEGIKAKEALCVLERNLRRRVDESVAFLEKGIPGIPARAILDSIERDRQSIKALTVLDC